MYKRSKKFISLVIVVCFMSFPINAYANPTGGVVEGGNANAVISEVGPNYDVTQIQDRAIINYDSFGNVSGETINFYQDKSWWLLNRVNDGGPISEIFGNLNAQGNIILSNRAGIHFGPGSSVNVGGIIATTLDISDSNFEAGDYTFESATGGAVLNYGDITALTAPGGFVALLGTRVRNLGTIEADLGRVILASGEKMTLNLDPAGLISVAVDILEATDQNPEGTYAAVNNIGTINADGGKVILTAEILDGVFTSAVNNDGIIEAGTLEQTGGQVLLKSNQNIELNGTIIATDSIDAYAQQNIILGKSIDDTTVSTFSWEYLEGSRVYLFKEFGYYTKADGTGPVILSKGFDIGKDANSPTSGQGIIDFRGDPIGIYADFDTTGIDDLGILRYFEDAALNPDSIDTNTLIDHLKIAGDVYSWEDLYGLGDHDFDDAEIDFSEDLYTIEAPDALLSSPNIFLTAKQGSITQEGGEIRNGNLMLESNTGISGIGSTVSGIGSNVALATHVNNLSALNKESGDIPINNQGTLTVADLSSVVGLNVIDSVPVSGKNGVTNEATGDEVNIEVVGEEVADLNVEAPINSHGPVILSAAYNIAHTAAGDVTIHQDSVIPMPDPLTSPSHVVGAVSTDRTVDVTWQLEETEPGYGFVGTAVNGEYAMGIGSEILTNGGDATVTADGDVSLALIDARNADVSVTSSNGDIIDADLGVPPGDYDIIAHDIKLSAPNGQIGSPSPGEIDLGFAYDFSHLFDNANNTDPDLVADAYNVSLFDKGEGVLSWMFDTTSDPLGEGSWWFHVATLGEKVVSETVSETAHIGPFIFETPLPPQYWENIEDELKVYYEILDPSQFLGFEPATKIGLYAYHPLTPTDASAFDAITLDAAAYEFIEGNINLNRAAPYFGLE